MCRIHYACYIILLEPKTKSTLLCSNKKLFAATISVLIKNMDKEFHYNQKVKYFAEAIRIVHCSK